MPLEAPKLDNRSFEELYRQALLRIPRYAPEWTDFNESDPGIALMQLFAWLTEMMLYEMNRVPERNYVKFLQLLNLELRPAQPAIAHLTFAVKPGAVVEPVRRRSQIAAQPPEGGDLLIFETESGLSLVRLPLTDVQVFDGAAFTVVTQANERAETPFRPMGWVPQLGSALYLGFSQTEPATTGRIFPQEIRMRVFLTTSDQLGVAQNCREAEEPPAPPVKLVWEYKPTADAARWKRLNVYEDESTAFTREGYIMLEGPGEIAATAEGKVDEARLWLRCRLADGRYPAGHAPVIDFVRPNTVEARNLTTVQEEVVGVSEGHPEQTFTLRFQPVQPGSLDLELEVEEQAPESWQQVEDFLASGPDDAHYVLNATRGELRFGDGKRGRIPVAGSTIVARQYRTGGGTAGNVGAGLINTPMTPLVGVESVTNARPAVGGRDEQDVETLKEQAPCLLRSRNRAMTAEDFAALAAQAGGVAKATAIPLAHPDHPGVEVPGAVTVVIVPDTKDKPPRPSSDQIRAVCRYLNQRRLLTSEVYVAEPKYQAIKVEATVIAHPYAAFDAVTRDVIKAINEHLDPLGQNANGRRWDFGDELFPTSLYSIILDVDGVDAVRDLALTVNGQPHDDITDPVIVPPDGLLYGVDDHGIVVIPSQDL
jgi:predicted phage baseplate assembly protein